MKKINWYLLLMFSAVLFSVSCNDDDDPIPGKQLKLNLTGLPNLGNNHVYEGWIIVSGAPVSTGTFTVSDNGTLSQTSFNVNNQQLAQASSFVLTIEPKPDTDPMPSGIKILAGDFSGNSSAVSLSHASALGTDFMNAAGSFILATPTNGMGTNENSGVWFLNPAAGPGPSLTLPTLPAGWKYEGWAVVNGMPLTTGKFTMNSGMDESAPFSGQLPGPPFPGEDYLTNAPTGLTFPTDLAGQKIVITVEPNPDNSTAPFMLKPLSGDVPANATNGVSYNLMNSASMSAPMGTVTR